MSDKKTKKPNAHNWFYGLPPLHGIIYRMTTFWLRVAGHTLWRIRIKGLDQLPKKEPYLLLGNHSSMLDPFWGGVHIMRGIRPMTSAAVLRVPILGSYLKMLGCFPKMKYVKDRESMKLLQENYENGYVIMLFPEGNRSWDGRMGDVGPGIGRLIKRLNCKVVYFRLNTASLFQPRWAKYPRWIPIELEYDGPHEYAEDATAEEIWEDVVQKITVTPELKKPARTAGFRMAHGLPEYLWACPSCFELEGLKVHAKNANAVSCDHCDEAWELNTFNQMKNAQGTQTVMEAFDKLADRYGHQPVACDIKFSESELVMNCENGKLLKLDSRTKKMNEVGIGDLRITAIGLELYVEAELRWSAVFAEIEAISVEIANLLHFRVEGELYRVLTPNQSPLKWAHFLRTWKQSGEIKEE